MPRKDGRLEPGQPLNGAISAGAWNRMMDAADVVMGDRYGFSGGTTAGDTSQLIVPVRVYPQSNSIFPGMAVQLTGAFPFQRIGTSSQTGALNTPYSGYCSVEYLSGLITRLDQSRAFPIAVTVDGTNTLDSMGSAVIRSVIRGLAVVRVRLFSTDHQFAVAPFAKGTEVDDVKYQGLLDSSPCACDGSVKVIAYDMAGPASTTSPENVPICWATVIV